MNTTSKLEIDALLADQRPTPECIQMLWLLLRSAEIFEKKKAAQIGKKLFLNASSSDVMRLVEVGLMFALIAETAPGVWKKNRQGQDFALEPHWRYWVPTSQAISALGEEQASALFPGRENFENRPVVIDLFAGVGGLSAAFEAAGFGVKVAVDNDPQACEAHEKNFPDCKVIQGDINEIAAHPKQMLCQAYGLDPSTIAGVVGGPPCQGFSYMGERASHDERNLLTSRFMDVVMDIEPSFFVMENVSGLLTSGSLPTFGTYLRRLGKSIGEPASKLVDKLPLSSIAKRDRQFRKKLISQAITAYRELISADVKNLLNLSAGAETLKKIFVELPKWLQEKAVAKYEVGDNSPEFKNIVAAILSGEAELAQLSLGIFTDIFLEQRLISDSEVEGYVKSLIKELPFALSSQIEELAIEYDQAPNSELYKGVKVGPILAHLIKRASDKYDVAAPRVLNAANYGAPQNRHRLFLVGIHKRFSRSFVFPEQKYILPGIESSLPLMALPEAPTVFQAICDLPDVDQFDFLLAGDQLPSKTLEQHAGEYVATMRLKSGFQPFDYTLPRPTWNPFVVDCCNRTVHTEGVLSRLRATDEGKQEDTSHKTRLNRTKVSHTLRAGTREGKGSHTAVRPVHYEHHRVITVREGARLMGYPDWMTFHHTKWHGFRLVGNGVPLQLGLHIAKALMEQLRSSPDV